MRIPSQVLIQSRGLKRRVRARTRAAVPPTRYMLMKVDRPLTDPGGSADPHVEVPAGLRYVDDTRPGYTRRQLDGKFVYFDTGGKRIRDEAMIARINALAIPPAYVDVWICPDARGHLQATGRDARGRKQYRYHAAWRELRDAGKYGRLTECGQVLPRIRARVKRDMKLDGLPRDKVLATIVHLLDVT